MHQHDSPTPYSPALVETLQTVIAPGERVRLSPFIEAAQFQVLFGQRPKPTSRNRDVQKILKDHEQDIKDLARRWVKFKSEGRQFAPGAYDDDFLRSYLVYYLTANVYKLQLTLLELVRQARLSGSLTVMDVGVGTGTTAVAALDFFVAWAHICTLYGAEFPIQSVQLVGVDVNPNCLESAQKVVLAYADALEERWKPDSEGGTASDILKRAEGWARRAQWDTCDLNQHTLSMPADKTLLVASNVLNELDQQGRQNIETAISDLSPGSIAIIIEPGDKGKTQGLNGWRKGLLQREHGLIAIAPCGQEHGNRQPRQCDHCWNARRESLHQTALYKQFRKAAAKLCPDDRSFDEFENNLLSWSYTCLLRSEGKRWPLPCPVIDTEGGEISEVATRYIGSFTESEPMAYTSDDLSSSPEKDWIEYIKLCPGVASQGIRGVYVERKPGFEYPVLVHGEVVNIESVNLVQRTDGVLKLVPKENSRLRPVRSPLSIQDTFLPDYSEPVQQVIDEIAYRLFGFPAMYPLQHQILERVLTGDHILGIAATGGGKSECFILPAMLLPGVTIVVSPLKSLMQDQYEQRICNRYGLDHLATFINGDVPFGERQTRLKRLELGRYKLVYFTPEQLERNYVLASLKRANESVGIRYIALDEAHCISQWGHDFRPSYLNLVRRLREWGIDPVRIALTATASPNVRRDVCEELYLNPTPLEEGGDVYVYSSNRPELNLIVRVVPDTATKSDDILDDLRHFLRENEHDQYPGAAIVFMPHTGGSPEFIGSYQPEKNPQSSQLGRFSAGVTRFASYLERRLRRRVAIYHSKMETDSTDDGETHDGEQRPLGDLSGRGRRSEQNAFIDNDREIMVATKGFGMGIDKSNIRLIIHRTPTANLEAYAQEAGRAGRDGELADVVLYYSPDRPEEVDNWGRQSTTWSDYEIQEFFLSEKYIRREDAMVMRAFLKTLKRQIGDHLYFTNDEAIAFFDSCQQQPGLAGLELPYVWPEFPKREPRGHESDEHKAILDRGYIYQEKTGYIDRILSVLYRIRPDLSTHKRLAFLERVQETGASLVKPQVKNPQAILQSNSYFGEILRGKGLTSNELKRWVQKGATRDLLGFARYLGLSLSETVAMFWDIQKADGYFDDRSGRWRPKLMGFRWIATPKYGLAAGKDSLEEWRNYAGAWKRANGNKRAKDHGRDTPTVNDWFGWPELTRPKGWEVLPGPAFKLDKHFDEYLDAFMALHDRRESNDWAAYHRLLTDYIGVDEDGQLRPHQSHNCLRAVLLGYLETYEVVTGDKCFSCSRCVSGGEFEQDIEKRKSVVVHLGKAVSELLYRLKGRANELPPAQVTEEFWQTVEREQQAGRSLLSYVAGWTGRLLDDTPGHQTALWLRLIGMARELISVHPPEFVDNARQLVESCSQVSLEQVWTVLETAHELLPETLEVYLVQAEACHRLSHFEQERETLQRLLDQDGAPPSILHEAHVALSTLYAPDGPLDDSDAYAHHTLEAARTATNPSEAIGFYRSLLVGWNWPRMEEELQWIEGNGQSDVVPSKLLELWLHTNPGPDSALLACQFLMEATRYKQWPSSAIEGLLLQIPYHFLLEQFPELLNWWLNIQAETSKPVPPGFAELAMGTVLKGQSLSPRVAQQCGQVLFERLSSTDSDALHKQYQANSTAIQRLLEALSPHYEPTPLPALVRWLNWFPPDVLLASAPRVSLRLLETAASQSNQIKIMTINQQELRQDLGALADGLLMQSEIRKAVHRARLKLCELWPDETLLHMRQCLLLEPPVTEMAEDCLDLLLRQENASLDQLINAVPSGRLAGRSERIDRVVEFIRLLNMLTTDSDIATTDYYLDRYHFLTIRMVFKPEGDIHRADMAATLIGHLRKSLNPSWHTPVALHVEVLGYARRFAEANEVASRYPGLTIGRKKEPVGTFLRRISGEPRTRPNSELDYRRVIEIRTKDWLCCKPMELRRV